MQIYWGVKPFYARRESSTDDLISASLELLKKKRDHHLR
jgi:pyruvate kinase